jgi:inorganic pyrophosphatase
MSKINLSSDDIEKIVEPLLKHREDYGYYRGIDAIQKILFDKAISEFKNRNDTKATFLRSLSTELDAYKIAAQQEFVESGHCPATEEAWKILDIALALLPEENLIFILAKKEREEE